MKVCNPVTFKDKVILGIGAHPDDIDFTASGSVASLVEAGATAYYLVLSDGGKGSRDHDITPAQLADVRRREQNVAARILGVKDVFFLDYEDGCMEVTMDLKRDIVRCIRHLKPAAIFVFDPTMVYSVSHSYLNINHPDHRATGQATLDAIYPLARDHLSMPELLQEGLEPHNTPVVFLVNFDNANCCFNITTTIDKKLQALKAHASQIPNFGALEPHIRGQAAKEGTMCGVEYAEAFVRVDIKGF